LQQRIMPVALQWYERALDMRHIALAIMKLR
jgi:hypothetical protein